LRKTFNIKIPDLQYISQPAATVRSLSPSSPEMEQSNLHACHLLSCTPHKPVHTVLHDNTHLPCEI